MVKFLTRNVLFVVFSTLLLASIILPTVVHSQIEFHIEKQWVKIWINKDGAIDLLYNLTLVCDAGTIRRISIGQPNKEFTVGLCVDLYNQTLQTERVINDWWGVKVHLREALRAGQKVTVILLTRVDRMIWEDEMNPGNVGMMFTACWWPSRVEDLRIKVVLPEGVGKDEIQCSPNWDNCSQDGDRWALYWERTNLSPDEKFTVGVGFPKRYVTKWYSKNMEDHGEGAPSVFAPLVPIFGVAFILVAIGAVVYGVVRGLKRIPYLPPKFAMEALGVRKGLTAVEAATLLNVKPTKVLTMILFGLMRKGVVEVVETKPRLRLRVVATQQPLRYYEEWFIDAIVPSEANRAGVLDDEKLALLIAKLRREVDEKVKYYCRADTVKYYRRIVRRAWKQVKRAKTPDVKAELFNENLEWLVISRKFRYMTRTAFSTDREVPLRVAWWFPYWAAHYSPKGARERAPAPTSISAPQAIPGVQFADAIVTTIESTANRIVSSLEVFSKSLVPLSQPAPAPKASAPPVHRSGCVCACASCACACACASCACACASGGVGG